MDASVSLPDPGEFHRGHQNGRASGLAIDDLAPFDHAGADPGGGMLDDPDLLSTPGVLPLDAPDVGEVLAAPGFDLTRDVVEEQTRALMVEFRAELDQFDRGGLDVLDGSSCSLARGREELLPGFEALTRGDLERARLGRGNQVAGRVDCPDWCTYADLPAHGDGFDTTREAEVPHRGVEHDVPARHGGQSLEHTGRAEVSAQLEQERDHTTGPVITLSVVVRGIEHNAWLTVAETTALHCILGQMLHDAIGHG